VYEYCDLRWSSIVATGVLAVLAGALAILFPRVVMSFLIVFSGLMILVLAGILIAEGLFSGSQRTPAWVIPGIGMAGR
jgi:uncharacterized membrane protein HdeD (DUF308 family)